MCGIWALFGGSDPTCEYCKAALTIAHRGPDAFRFETIQGFPKAFMAHHRLAIVGNILGIQPVRIAEFPQLSVIHNGEILNFEQLAKEDDFQGKENSDAVSIIRLYAKGGIDFAVRHLDGSFAFCLLDAANRKVFLGRDLYGIRPAYRLHTSDGLLAVCSEAKGLMSMTDIHGGKIEEVPPGHVEIYQLDQEGFATFEKRTKFYNVGQPPAYKTVVDIRDKYTVEENIKRLLEDAVVKRMTLHSTRKFGCLLSGDIASTVVASILVREAKRHKITYKIQTFSVCIENDSSHLQTCRQVAEFLGTEHHEVMFTTDDAVKSVKDIIYHLESYDVNTIRASFGMYLVSKYIREKTNTVILLTGYGAKEIVTNRSTDGKWTMQRSTQLHSNIMIVDRTTAAAGLESRYPFLDQQISSYLLSLQKDHRHPKRELLQTVFKDILPKNMIWETQDAYEEGVVHWIGKLQDALDGKIQDEIRGRRKRAITPQNEEATYYKQVFDKYFQGQGDWLEHI